jgi:hypothetical protein
MPPAVPTQPFKSGAVATGIRLLLVVATVVFVAPGWACAREENDSYRQLKAAIRCCGVTLGDSTKFARSRDGGFSGFLGMNFFDRTTLGPPFDPVTRLTLITDVHLSVVIGMTFNIDSKAPAAVAAVEALKSKIEAIYQITLPRDGPKTEKDSVFLAWRTAQDSTVELVVYDQKLHDELRPAPDEK